MIIDMLYKHTHSWVFEGVLRRDKAVSSQWCAFMLSPPDECIVGKDLPWLYWWNIATLDCAEDASPE